MLGERAARQFTAKQSQKSCRVAAVQVVGVPGALNVSLLLWRPGVQVQQGVQCGWRVALCSLVVVFYSSSGRGGGMSVLSHCRCRCFVNPCMKQLIWDFRF